MELKRLHANAVPAALEKADHYYDHGEVPVDGKFYLPVSCMQCDDPPCVRSCPVEATWREQDGIVVVDYDWCIGCRYCIAACPYWARRFNWSEPVVPTADVNPNQHYLGNRLRRKGCVEKCTFCIQRIRVAKADARPDKPADNPRLTACAEVCPTNALTFGDSNDPDSKVSQLQAEPRSYQLLGELNTKNGVQYSAKLSLTKLHKPEAH